VREAGAAEWAAETVVGLAEVVVVARAGEAILAVHWNQLIYLPSDMPACRAVALSEFG
jgi:hypothetical protein